MLRESRRASSTNCWNFARSAAGGAAVSACSIVARGRHPANRPLAGEKFLEKTFHLIRESFFWAKCLLSSAPARRDQGEEFGIMREEGLVNMAALVKTRTLWARTELYGALEAITSKRCTVTGRGPSSSLVVPHVLTNDLQVRLLLLLLFVTLPCFAFSMERVSIRPCQLLEKPHRKRPRILRGQTRPQGNRIPLGTCARYLAAGKTAEDLSRNFPISHATKSPHVWTTPRMPNLRPSSDGPAVPG